uniref:Putative retrotransposon protein n=1 Tax=Phyllostachys edulis TaxID=38705 RepID=D3IVR4_PHYED|nr:putative retrotransposon protein [Phyllostachys edulis]
MGLSLESLALVPKSKSDFRIDTFPSSFSEGPHTFGSRLPEHETRHREPVKRDFLSDNLAKFVPKFWKFGIRTQVIKRDDIINSISPEDLASFENLDGSSQPQGQAEGSQPQDQAGGMPSSGSTAASTSVTTNVKRSRSITLGVWEDFDRTTKEYAQGALSSGGTEHLIRHAARCKARQGLVMSQTQLQYNLDGTRRSWDYSLERCACHIINLIVKYGLKRLDMYIKAFRDVISFLNHSNQRIAAYKNFCRAMDVRPRKFGFDMLAFENEIDLGEAIIAMKFKYLKYWREIPFTYAFEFILDPRAKIQGFANVLEFLSDTHAKTTLTIWKMFVLIFLSFFKVPVSTVSFEAAFSLCRRNDYDEEIVRRFYATMHVSPDFTKMQWLIVTRYVESSKKEFERVLRTPSSKYEKIFDRPALLAPVWTDFYDQTVRYTLGKIHGLQPIPSLINRIINHTFLPKSENFDAIRGNAWNIIGNIMNERKFDVVDVIIRGIASSKNDRVKRIYYAPYIMALILSKIEYHGELGSPHKAYKPRDGPPQQRGQTEDAPGEAAAEEEQVSLAQILNNQQFILSNLQVIMTNQQEFKDTQQEMKTAQIEFHNETRNRLAALSESVFFMEHS